MRNAVQSRAVDPLLASFVDAVADDDRRSAAERLRQFSKSAGAVDYPAAWLSETCSCLETGEWGSLSRPFVRESFVGPKGDFLIAGPYAIRRGDAERLSLSTIIGQVLPHSPMNADMEGLVRKTCGRLGERVPHLLPVRPLVSCGSFGTEEGEAFIVPDGWAWAGRALGPPLNDMTEQRRRFVEQGRECLRRIFEPESAELLVGALEDEESGPVTQHLEYQYHEAGHASGIGLEQRLFERCLPTNWHRGVEEWRSDGVAFELARRTLSPVDSGKLVASNLCIRFGIDAQRRGGIDRDTDMNCSLLTLDRLLRSGSLRIHGGRLGFLVPTYPSLALAVEALAFEAVQLTRAELGSEASGIIRRYARVDVAPATRDIFRRLVVDCCLGIFRALR
jgi:hypothetical protein